VAGGVAGEFGRMRLSTMPVQAWVALVYLVLFGSLLAFSAYVWLLANAPLSLTATYAYVNPVVAVVLGALILGEQVTWPILLGGAVVVAGVSLVVSAERPRGAPRNGRPARTRTGQPSRDGRPVHVPGRTSRDGQPGGGQARQVPGQPR